MKPLVVSGQEQITANNDLKSITITFIIYILGLILWAIATNMSRDLWSDRFNDISSIGLIKAIKLKKSQLRNFFI